MRIGETQGIVDRADVDKIRHGLDDLLQICDGGVGAQLLEAYFGDAPPFTGAHFDSVGTNSPGRFAGDDLAALALLDVPPPRQLVVNVLVDRADEYNRMLVAIPDDVDLWDAEVDHLESAGTLRQQLKAIDDVGWVTAHKLIARKRPRLHPVYDRVVHRWFHAPDGIRYGLGVVLGDDPDLREALNAALPTDAADGRHLLRRIDIAIWLLGAHNDAAAAVREPLGVVAPGRS